MTPASRLSAASVLTLALALGGTACSRSATRADTAPADTAPAGTAPPTKVPDNVYSTYGVHNSAHAKDCAAMSCEYTRSAGEPTDPLYPEYWTSNWTMYRVFRQSETHPPPYDGKPPAPLVEGQDYEVSYGTTYYDSTWMDGQGAMMEHYDKRCLPIFPMSNHYTCSFISLGDTAFFVTYDADRPKDMPPVCLFSLRNHPPRRDFIKHLPYSAGDSARLGGRVQGYSIWVEHKTGKIMQTGASPDRTQDDGILFGYAFDSTATPDRVDKAAAPYRHPQSFYFSGVPVSPPDAPIVSQNYTDFAMIKPDPAQTWARVSGLDPATLPKCHLFKPKGQATPLMKSGKPAPTWGTIGRQQ